MNLKEAREMANKMYDDVALHDFAVNQKARIVAIQHADRSYLEFWSACYKELDKNWIAVFTEHHGCFVYHKEDVEWVREWLTPELCYYNRINFFNEGEE
jgi:hypothetical protein